MRVEEGVADLQVAAEVATCKLCHGIGYGTGD